MKEAAIVKEAARRAVREARVQSLQVGLCRRSPFSVSQGPCMADRSWANGPCNACRSSVA